MKEAGIKMARAVLLIAIAGIGALALYFGVMLSADASIASSCRPDQSGQFTITITKYNVASGVHCAKL